MLFRDAQKFFRVFYFALRSALWLANQAEAEVTAAVRRDALVAKRNAT